MRNLSAILALACLVLPAHGARAQGTEPTVYFFWSASCRYSQAAHKFLLAAQAKDRSLRVRDFEVDESIPNAQLLVRFYQRIGLPQVHVVPTTVIGHHVVIGYIDDTTTGAEVLEHVAECRKAGCKDAVRDLIEEPLEAVAAAAPMPRLACQREPGRAVR